MIILLIVAVPALGALLAWFLKRQSMLLLVGVALLDAGLATAIAFGVETSRPLYLVQRYIVLDPTSQLFLMLINALFLGIATYVYARVWNTPQLRHRIERFVALSLIFIAAGNLAVLSNHLLAMWAFIVVTALSAVPLIQHGGNPKAVRASGRYMVFSSVGLALALLGFACLARSMELGPHEPTYFLDQIAATTSAEPEIWRRLGILLLFLGFGTKLGLAPMYAWLPETYDAAPPPVTALLASVQFNVVLVAVLRVLQAYQATNQSLVTFSLVGLGVSTMVVSSFGIIATRNYKRLIAYASLNHGGVIAVGLGIGRLATFGVLLYVVSNAIIKSILFLTAGKIRAQYKTEDMREVSGLIKDLPESGMFFLVGTFALLGFPPFGSFLGELIIMSALVSGEHFAVFVIFCAILMITFVATGRSVFPMVWGTSQRVMEIAPQPRGAVIPKLLFLVFLVAMGLYLPAPINLLFRQVASSLGTQ
ncbi:MAG: hyfF [Myxococcaceae bacterium]|nr:hyfF [Myxococcaceae bacterium]